MGANFYSGKKILITGGAGFLGSNMTRTLIESGASVVVLDNFHPDYGANLYNFLGIEKQVEIQKGDILDEQLIKKLASNADLIFHIAAQCSHVDSMTNPWLDLDFNCKGTLCVLEAAKASPKQPPIVYAGTRAIIGAPLHLPAAESTLPNPVDIYGVNKHAAELYGAVYSRVHKIPFVSIRLTNSYGARHQMKNGKYGILNWFISLGLQGKPIKVFGTGEQLRDYLYIDDAVEAFLKSGEFAFQMKTKPSLYPKTQLSGQNIPYAVFNIGSGKGMRFVDCAAKVAEETGGKLEMIEWPKDRAAIETGDFVSDGTAAAEALSWKPKTGFDVGLKKTVSFYREHLPHYL
jgi:UDP-glucose 4-epimerase